MARRRRRGPPRPGRIRRPHLRAPICGSGDALGRRRRADRDPVVAAVQPRALVRAAGRDRADDRRADPGKVGRPPVDCRRRDGLLELHPDDTDLEPGAGRLGGGEPPSRAGSSRRCGGRRRRARMPAVDGGADRWHQRRRTVGFPLAVDEDARGAAAGSGLRRTQGRRSGSGRRRSYRRQPAPGDTRRAPRRGSGQARQDGTGRRRGAGEACGMARLSRAGARRRDSRRADRDRLVAVAAGAVVAARRSGPAGRRSPSAATCSTRRSSAAATRSSPVTG